MPRPQITCKNAIVAGRLEQQLDERSTVMDLVRQLDAAYAQQEFRLYNLNLFLPCNKLSDMKQEQPMLLFDGASIWAAHTLSVKSAEGIHAEIAQLPLSAIANPLDQSVRAALFHCIRLTSFHYRHRSSPPPLALFVLLIKSLAQPPPRSASRPSRTIRASRFPPPVQTVLCCDASLYLLLSRIQHQNLHADRQADRLHAQARHDGRWPQADAPGQGGHSARPAAPHLL